MNRCRVTLFRSPWACLALTALTLSCASTPRDEPPTEIEAEAGLALASGDVEKGLELFRAAVYEERSSYRALVGLALCNAYLGKMGRFETLALEAASSAPVTPTAHAAVGQMFIQGAERFRSQPASLRYAQVGVDYLRRVFAAIPDWPHLLRNLGLGLHLMDNVQGAALMLEEAHRQNSSDLGVLRLLLVSLRELERAERVHQLLNPLVIADQLPDSWRSVWQWSVAARAMGEDAAAVRPKT